MFHSHGNDPTPGKSARLVMTWFGLWLDGLVVPGRVLAAHIVPNPREKEITIAEVILVVLVLGGILLASFLPKRRRPRLRKRRFRLK